MPIGDQAPGEAGNAPQQATDAPERLNAAMEALRQSIDKQTGTWDDVLKVMREVAGTAETVAEEFTGAATSAEDLVKYIGTARDRLRVLTTEAKKLGANLGTLSFKKAGEQLRTMREEAERLAKSGNLTKREMNDLHIAIRKCSDGERLLSRHQSDFNAKVKSNKDEYREVADILKVIQDRTIAITQRVKTGGVNQKIMAMNAVLGGGSGRVEKAHRTAQAAYEKRQELAEVKAGHKRTHRDKNANIMARLHAAGIDVHDEQGRIDPKKWKSKEVRDVIADTLTEGHCGEKSGWLNRKLVSMALKSQQEEGGGGFVSKAVTGLAAQGGGNVFTGLAHGATDMGLGAIEKLAGPVGIGMAAVGALGDLVDKVAKQNQETEKNLGKAGIFTAGVGGGRALMNVRQNLMAYGLNAHNITTERQMAVAQTMQEEGAGLAELARPSKGFFEGNPRSVGDIGNIVFKQAREVGLTDVEGTKQVMKMLQTYKMTLTGTQDFFRTIGKDIHAAGISTTKYLQLIDDITDQFGSMNKSIETTTSLLRMLGSAGTSTYDQLKEDVSALTEDKSSLEQRSALFQMQSPGTRATFVKTQEEAARNASDTLASGLDTAMEHLSMNKEDIWKGLDRNSGRDVEKAYTRFKRNMPSNADAGVFTTPLEGYLRQYQAAQGRAVVAQHGNPVQLGAMMDVLGKTPEGNMTLNLSRMNEVLKQQKTSFGAAIANPTAALATNPLLLDKLTEAFGGDPSKALNLLNESSEAIEKEVKSMKEGGLGAAFNAPQEEENFYEGILRKTGTAFKPGGAKELVTNMDDKSLDKLTESLKQNTDAGDILELLADPNNPIARVLKLNHTEEKTEQERNTAEIASGTRTISGLLSTISDNILSKIGQPLMMLVDFMLNPSAADRSAVEEASHIGEDTKAQMDATTVAQIVKLDTQNKWKDVAGPMPDRTAADIWQNFNRLQEEQKEHGMLSAADAKQLLALRDAIESMAGHAKFQGLEGTGHHWDEIRDMEYKTLKTVYEASKGGFVSNTNPVAAAQGQVPATGAGAPNQTTPAPTVQVNKTVNVGTLKTAVPPTPSTKPASGETVPGGGLPGVDTGFDNSLYQAMSGGRY
jgi:hypothetical protein